jgi:hypothetical protein
MNSSEQAYVDPQRRALADLMWPDYPDPLGEWHQDPCDDLTGVGVDETLEPAHQGVMKP